MLDSMQKQNTKNMAKGDCISKAPNRAITTPMFRAFASSLNCLLISDLGNGSIGFLLLMLDKAFFAPARAKTEEKIFAFNCR